MAVRVPHELSVLDRVRKRDAVQLLLGFEKKTATPRAAKAFRTLVHRWIDAVDWRAAGGQPAFAPLELGERSADVTFTGTTRPRAAVEALLAKLEGLTEAVVMRRPVARDGSLDRPTWPGDLAKEKDYKRPSAWWKASFDKKVVPPMREDPQGMFSMVRLESGAMLSEVRPVPIASRAVRIVYGLADGVEYPPTNARAKAVTKTVTASLKGAFGGRPPLLYNAEAQPNRTFERISKDGRSGYVFALSREDEMLAMYPSSYRYREHELMAGLEDAIGRLELAPVIHWIRDHAFMVNLWERK